MIVKKRDSHSLEIYNICMGGIYEDIRSIFRRGFGGYSQRVPSAAKFLAFRGAKLNTVMCRALTIELAAKNACFRSNKFDQFFENSERRRPILAKLAG